MSSKLECERAPRIGNGFDQGLRQYRQLQTGKGAGEDAYNGMVDCFRKIIKHEGYLVPRDPAWLMLTQNG